MEDDICEDYLRQCVLKESLSVRTPLSYLAALPDDLERVVQRMRMLLLSCPGSVGNAYGSRTSKLFSKTFLLLYAIYYNPPSYITSFPKARFTLSVRPF